MLQQQWNSLLNTVIGAFADKNESNNQKPNNQNGNKSLIVALESAKTFEKRKNERFNEILKDKVVK